MRTINRCLILFCFVISVLKVERKLSGCSILFAVPTQKKHKTTFSAALSLWLETF